MIQELLRFEQIDLGNDTEVKFLFATRAHPEVSKFLLGKAPESYKEHESWLRQNVPSRRRMFLLSSGETYYGYCHAYDYLNKDTVEIGFVVYPSFQGRGYGHIMVKGLVDWLRENMSDRTIILYVKPGNDKAVSLYLKHGFVSKGETEAGILYELA